MNTIAIDNLTTIKYIFIFFSLLHIINFTNLLLFTSIFNVLLKIY